MFASGLQPQTLSQLILLRLLTLKVCCSMLSLPLVAESGSRVLLSFSKILKPVLHNPLSIVSQTASVLVNPLLLNLLGVR